MSILEMIAGGVIIVLSVLLVAVTINQTQKQQGMTSAISGTANTDSFYEKHGGNTKEKSLERLTKIMTIIFFVLIIAINLIDAFTTTAE